MLTRRKFLGECSLLAAAACLHPVAVMADQPATPLKLADFPGFAEFFTQVNTTFTVRAAALPTPLLLVAVTPLTASRIDPAVTGNEAFCLRFRGPAQPRLAQDTYLFDHLRFGALEIFLVPVGRPDPAAGHYEAVFDRPVSSDLLARQIARAPQRVQTT